MMDGRSWLFVPGDSAGKIERAFKGDADALIFDWEDAIAPTAKVAGRAITLAALAAAGQAKSRCWIRMNALASPWFIEDLQALPAASITGVVLPKSCGLLDLEKLGRALATVEASTGLEPRSLGIVAIVTETAASVLALSEFRKPVPRLTAMLWGGEDLASDLGVARNRDENGVYRAPFLLARNMMLMAAAAAECTAIDAVYTDFRNSVGLVAECVEARADGFTAKAAVHPDQVDLINQAFAATPQERAWAEQVVVALKNGGVAVVESKMVDAPHLRLARRILAS